MGTYTVKERFAYLMYNRPPAGRVKTKQMKTLKLEVGKTYRSRSGEEVKIVRDGWGRYPYESSDGECYTENGRFDYYVQESCNDLIEEVSEPTRHTFDIPDGVKKITVSQVGNCIVVEMVPEKEPKPGDVLVNTNGSVYIFKEAISRNKHKHFAWLGRSGRLVYNDVAISGRPATPEEAQPLWDALKKAGKRWNPVTQVVEEEITEIDHIREWVWANLKSALYDKGSVAEAIEEYLKYREGEK